MASWMPGGSNLAYGEDARSTRTTYWRPVARSTRDQSQHEDDACYPGVALPGRRRGVAAYSRLSVSLSDGGGR
jgi:hypothetical protein